MNTAQKEPCSVLLSPQKVCSSTDSWHRCQVDACITQGRLQHISCSILLWHGHFSHMRWHLPRACMWLTFSVSHTNAAMWQTLRVTNKPGTHNLFLDVA